MHKKGNKIDPCNYSCISISSNLGKVFNRLIHTRLLQFIEESKIISKNKIGFMEKGRTADHIFSLKSIIDSYKQKKKKVYAAFIDLRKAYDSLWRTGLFYILLERGLSKKIVNVIYSIYADTKSRIKFSDGVSKSFLSKRGVKQSDVLSPMLFNIFINNIVEKLVMWIQFWLVTSLSIVYYYADDLILLASSPCGLQTFS